MPSYGTIPELPHVVKLFCPFECVRLIQDLASMRNVDSRIHSLRFDSCVFLFYSFSTVTFATQSALFGRASRANQCPVSGVKQPCRKNLETAEFDRACSLIPGLDSSSPVNILAGSRVLSAVGACPLHDGVR